MCYIGLVLGSQVAERLGNMASNLKVASSIPGLAKLHCVLVVVYLTLLASGGNVPVLTVHCSG